VEVFRSGLVSITGRPNVGKSTLLNAILGQKVAIVSSKPQTTRNRLTGIKTMKDCQIIFFDTPGIHKPLHKLGELMVKSAVDTVQEVDSVLLLVLPKLPGTDDIKMAREVTESGKKTILVINKIDTVKKEALLPVIGKYKELFSFEEIIPLSALTGDGIDILIKCIKKHLPEGSKLYPDDLATDQIERFMVAEIVREKIMTHTEDEVPYSVAVEVKSWSEEPRLVRIGANIYVERDSQKGIIIGNKGSLLKTIGSEARREIEDLLGVKVFLSLWVKVKKGWRENAFFLKEIGIN
jgi:GTP-binding protein Era